MAGLDGGRQLLPPNAMLRDGVLSIIFHDRQHWDDGEGVRQRSLLRARQ
jgi:hypothetical protein